MGFQVSAGTGSILPRNPSRPAMNTRNLPGQPHLAYRGNSLFLEESRLSDLAKNHGTPLFVYSKSAMLAALTAYQRGFAGHKVQICYAMKANPALGVIQVFAQAGCGFDIVSGGDMDRVLTAGGQADKIIFSGVGKTRAEMRRALAAGIGCFNVESEAELDVLNEVASGNPSHHHKVIVLYFQCHRQPRRPKEARSWRSTSFFTRPLTTSRASRRASSMMVVA